MRKITTFSISKYSASIRDYREEAADFLAANSGQPYINNIRDAYRFVANFDDFYATSYIEDRPTAESLRNELIVASIAAGQAGASGAQIDYIVSLCGENEGYERMGYTRLTSKQASSLINDLKA